MKVKKMCQFLWEQKREEPKIKVSKFKYFIEVIYSQHNKVWISLWTK